MKKIKKEVVIVVVVLLVGCVGCGRQVIPDTISASRNCHEQATYDNEGRVVS